MLDARAVADELGRRGVSLALKKQAHDPTDPRGRMFFNILATFAEFESDMIPLRTRQGMEIARDTGNLRDRTPNLFDLQQRSDKTVPMLLYSKRPKRKRQQRRHLKPMYIHSAQCPSSQ